MRRLAILPALLLAVSLSAATFPTGFPTTTNNDDTCDISLLPAATLLLPYFEVDVTAPGAETTLFTITNTHELPQVAKVTLWTDYAYPVITFSVFLTGYDVQSINLYDVIARGQLAPDRGTGYDVSPVGELSGDFVAEKVFDNPLLNEAGCINIPVQLPQLFITRMVRAFTEGIAPAFAGVPECRTIGGTHPNAVGYATIDVMGSCAPNVPTDASYFGDDIRFDNVLIGDYQQVNGLQDHSQANPLVHIRAVAEGGDRAAGTATNLPRTFYSRFQPAASPRADRRQPLPATFAARWIDGGPTGFATLYKIWREGETAASAACDAFPMNSAMSLRELVRFDEDENPETLAPSPVEDVFPDLRPVLAATTLVDSSSEAHFPANTYDGRGGWMYLNLSDYRVTATVAKQNWVVVSMRAEGRFSGDMDAQALGNGCTAVIPESKATGGQRAIGPAPNSTP
jgi:hypothetical protein